MSEVTITLRLPKELVERAKAAGLDVRTVTPEVIELIEQRLSDRLAVESSEPKRRLDVEAILRTFAQLHDGFSEQDLDEFERAVNAKVIKPLDSDEDA